MEPTLPQQLEVKESKSRDRAATEGVTTSSKKPSIAIASKKAKKQFKKSQKQLEQEVAQSKQSQLEALPPPEDAGKAQGAVSPASSPEPSSTRKEKKDGSKKHGERRRNLTLSIKQSQEVGWSLH